MTALFSSPKVQGPDASLVAAQKDQIAQANARETELKGEEEARKRALASRSQGRRSLLGPAGEVGVSDLKTVLGG